MRFLSKALVVVAVGCLVSGCGDSPTPQSENTNVSSTANPKSKSSVPVSQYTVVSTEDVSYASVVRKSYRVRIPREMTKQELTGISNEIVHQATSRQKIKAIMIYYFLPDSDTSGAFTAGKATWAPSGDWSKASTSLSPTLVVETGGAMGTISQENVVDLPVAKKKQIFMQIVRNEDSGMENDQSYASVAQQFGISSDQAKKISLEGIIKGWPMP